MSAQISEVGLKIASTKVGCTPAEYLAHLDAGEAWCSGHRAWHSRDVFRESRWTWNGLAPSCRQAHSDYDRARYARQRRAGSETGRS